VLLAGERRLEMSKAARIGAERFALSRIVADYDALLEQVAS
jgi:hypothetical protein